MTLSDNTFVRGTGSQRAKGIDNVDSITINDSYEVAELVTIGGSMIHRTGEVIGFKELKSERMMQTFIIAVESKIMESKTILEVIDYYIDFEI